METIKYEAVFGDQSLFTQDETEIIYKCDKGSITEASLKFLGKSIDNGGIIAMRRIIKTPVWTVADQKAGIFPEVGCKALWLFDKVVSVTSVDIKNGWLTVQYENDQCVDICRLSILTPIETQEERAQRLRDEWCSKALDSAGILSEMKRYELKRLGEYIGSIHDALLSGELQSPKDCK